MQAIILAAGKSSRFYPYNLTGHKSTFKILGKSIIEHTLLSIKSAGIKDVIVVVSPVTSIPNLVNTNELKGVKVTFVEQKESLGAGNAILCALKYIKGDFFVLNAHRFDFHIFKSELDKKLDKKSDAVLLTTKDSRLSRFGFLTVKNDQVVDVIEKPTFKDNTSSNLRVVGVYLFRKKFLDVLSQTSIHENQLEEAISSVAKTSVVRVVLTDKEVMSLKYPWDILEIKNYLFKNVKGHIGKNVKIAKSAIIEGDIYIEDGVVIMEGVCIKGPCFVGKNSVIGNNVLLRDFVDIEENTTVGAFTEVKNCLFGHHSSVHSGFIGDSIVGDYSKIGGFINTANVRLDRGSISVKINDKKVDTEKISLGVMIGNNVKIGVGVITMPGIIIGNNSVIGPGTIVSKNVSEKTLYYSNFQKNIKKSIK